MYGDVHDEIQFNVVVESAAFHEIDLSEENVNVEKGCSPRISDCGGGVVHSEFM